MRHHALSAFTLLSLAAGCTLTADLPDEADDAVADPHDVDVADPTGGGALDHPPGDDPTPPGTSPAACPASYDLVLAGYPSRYRVIASADVFAAHHGDCRDDATGATHLLAIDAPGELAAVQAHAKIVAPGAAFYVGAVQTPGELGMADGWLIFTGTALPGNLWAVGQPNDGDAWESFDEQRAVVDQTGRLHDVGGAAKYGAICECDGRPISPVVLTALEF